MESTSTELNINPATPTSLLLSLPNVSSPLSNPTSTSTPVPTDASVSRAGDAGPAGGLDALSTALVPFIEKATATARRALAASATAVGSEEEGEGAGGGREAAQGRAKRKEEEVGGAASDEGRGGSGDFSEIQGQEEGVGVDGDLLLESHSSIASACKVLEAEIRTFAVTKVGEAIAIATAKHSL